MDANRWQQLGLKAQLGHITSEIARAKDWEEKGDLSARREALTRALELIDLTLAHRPSGKRELTRLREMVSDCWLQSGFYQVGLADLQQYGMQYLGVFN
tara:strand:- start:129 stop:425 length:297 start_codon:yes stop_codon:yes gene_type:complete